MKKFDIEFFRVHARSCVRSTAAALFAAYMEGMGTLIAGSVKNQLARSLVLLVMRDVKWKHE